MPSRLVFSVPLACLLGVSAASADEIDVGAPEGATTTTELERAAEVYKLPIARFGGADAPFVTIEGRTKWAALTIDEASTEEIVHWYRERLSKMGFEIVLDCAGRDCGGFDFRFGAQVLSPPAMQIDVADFAQLSMTRSEPAGVVSVLASRVRGIAYVQTVTVVPSDGVVSLEPDTAEPKPEVIETRAAPDAAAESQEDSTSETPYDRLIARGHLVVSGVDFATGGAKIASASGPALDRVAEMLQQNADLRVAIVGHSDNQGGLNANIALSQRRAQAVMQALVKRGIASDRLEARGIGYLAPLRSNTTEEGRAVNRRVELVVR